MNADRRVPELDVLRAALVAGVLVFHAVHVFDPLDFYVKRRCRVARAEGRRRLAAPARRRRGSPAA